MIEFLGQACIVTFLLLAIFTMVAAMVMVIDSIWSDFKKRRAWSS